MSSTMPVGSTGISFVDRASRAPAANAAVTARERGIGPALGLKRSRTSDAHQNMGVHSSKSLPMPSVVRGGCRGLRDAVSGLRDAGSGLVRRVRVFVNQPWRRKVSLTIGANFCDVMSVH